MTPVNFPEVNTIYGPPPDMTEQQVRSIPAYRAEVRSGSCDGLALVVVAWQPSEGDIMDIINGKPIYLSMTGGLMPHFLTMDFEQAKTPA